MKDFNWKEFKPTLLFLAKFVGLYIVANMVYGLFITAYAPVADPVTHAVTEQCGWILDVTGWPVTVQDEALKSTTLIVHEGTARIAVYEGCNGVNVMIIFLSFLLAFGPYTRAMAWFAPLGVMVIHAGNLARIVLLFLVTLYYPNYLYYLHKYFFTAIIYVVVFILWIIWVRKFSRQ